MDEKDQASLTIDTIINASPLENQCNTIRQQKQETVVVLQNLKQQLSNAFEQGDENQASEFAKLITQTNSKLKSLESELVELENQKQEVRSRLDKIKGSFLLSKSTTEERRNEVASFRTQVHQIFASFGINSDWIEKLQTELKKQNVLLERATERLDSLDIGSDILSEQHIQELRSIRKKNICENQELEGFVDQFLKHLNNLSNFMSFLSQDHRPLLPNISLSPSSSFQQSQQPQQQSSPHSYESRDRPASRPQTSQPRSHFQHQSQSQQHNQPRSSQHQHSQQQSQIRHPSSQHKRRHESHDMQDDQDEENSSSSFPASISNLIGSFPEFPFLRR